MFQLIDRLRRALGLLSKPSRRINSFASVTELESTALISPSRNHLFLIGSGRRMKWVKFVCPCGCGELLALNLMESHSPRWSVTRDEADRVTLWPSVHSTECGAHFFVRSNRIHWC